MKRVTIDSWRRCWKSIEATKPAEESSNIVWLLTLFYRLKRRYEFNIPKARDKAFYCVLLYAIFLVNYKSVAMTYQITLISRLNMNIFFVERMNPLTYYMLYGQQVFTPVYSPAYSPIVYSASPLQLQLSQSNLLEKVTSETVARPPNPLPHIFKLEKPPQKHAVVPSSL